MEREGFFPLTCLNIEVDTQQPPCKPPVQGLDGQEDQVMRAYCKPFLAEFLCCLGLCSAASRSVYCRTLCLNSTLCAHQGLFEERVASEISLENALTVLQWFIRI